jgi:hypothetical protein
MRKLILLLALLQLAAPLVTAQAVAKPLQKPDGPPVLSLPEDLVRELYKVHRNGYGHLFDKQGRKLQQKFFDQKLAGLIWKDLTETPEGEVGHIDFDPLYNAQDMQIKSLRVGAAVLKGDTASVPVTFLNYNQKVRIDFRLVNTAAGWKIVNILYGDSDLVKILSEPM